jgi:hypothetical protein
MLIRYTPGRKGPAAWLRRAARSLLYLPTACRMALDPYYPWLNAGAVRWLDRRLRPGMIGFEWGGGRSTVFFARRVSRLMTVEHREKWRRKVAGMLRECGLANVELRFLPPGEASGVPQTRPGLWRRMGYIAQKPEFTAYADAILDQPEASLDFVSIDGRARVACALNAASRIRPGGFLLLDNSEWEKYAPVFAALTAWPRLDFENGVWRTTIFLSPPATDG